MKRVIILIVFLGLFIAAGCTDDSPLAPEADQVVIQGYLYAGEPVTDIQITSTLPLGSQDTLAPPINDAEVYLIKNGQRYNLQPSSGDSGYYHYEGSDLSVEVGDVFEINVSYYGTIASGETGVPPAPASVSISSNTLYIPESISPFDFEFDSTKHQLDVTWDPESSALFYVTIENIEPDPEPIERYGFMRGGPGRFISAPTSSNEYRIMFMSVTHYGRHRVKVYRVNQEYADLYISRLQDSRDLNEPLTNIVNGLGVFSAFNSSDYLYFQAVRE